MFDIVSVGNVPDVRGRQVPLLARGQLLGNGRRARFSRRQCESLLIYPSRNYSAVKGRPEFLFEQIFMSLIIAMYNAQIRGGDTFIRIFFREYYNTSHSG